MTGLTRKRTRARIGVGVVCLALLAVATAALALDVPYLSGRVNDLARMLTPAGRDRLDGKLADLERRTGAQVAVLTVQSLEGESLEAYSVKVAQTWKLGRKGVDDGVLFFVAKQDRKMRIEVGYGLESRLTDLVSRRILDEMVRPRFRANDFDGGVEAGVDAVIAVISGESLPAPRPATPQGAVAGVLGILLFLGLFGVVVGSFSVLALVTPGFGGWFLYLILIPFYIGLLAQVLPPYGGALGGGTWIVGYPMLRRWLRPGSKEFTKLHPRLAGFAGSHGHSGSGGGFSGGGGGFSGGGGGFGGGGSSSSW